MPDFQYTARDFTGQKKTGLLTAGSPDEAVRMLRDQSLFALDVAPVAPPAARRIWRRGVGSGQLAVVYAQLADLLRAGVPLLRSLEILEHQATHPSLAAILKDVREDVADGTRLAEALRSHQKVFGELAVSMIHAGEEGGFLEDVLKRISLFTEHQEDLKSRVLGALVYPLFLMGLGLIVVAGMLIFFVPMFEPIFERSRERGTLPLPTTILLGASGFLQQYWVLIGIGLAAIVWQVARWAATPAGRDRVDSAKITAPGLGRILRSLAIARFCRVLGTLLKNGVPILPSLRIAKDATGNRRLSTAINRAADNISSGKSLARPLASSHEFPVEIVEMISVGEEANNLEQVLLDIADTLEKRTHRQLDLFVRLLEPVMLLIMAIAILFLVIALLLPVFQSAGTI